MSDLPMDQIEIREDPEEVHKIYRQSFIDEQEWYLYKYIESEMREMAKDRANPSMKRIAVTVRGRVARRYAYFLFNIFSVTVSMQNHRYKLLQKYLISICHHTNHLFIHW